MDLTTYLFLSSGNQPSPEKIKGLVAPRSTVPFLSIKPVQAIPFQEVPASSSQTSLLPLVQHKLSRRVGRSPGTQVLVQRDGISSVVGVLRPCMRAGGGHPAGRKSQPRILWRV